MTTTYRLQHGMPASRVLGGKRYAYWFHADTKAEAEKLKREFTNPGVSRIRVVKKSKGYDIYGYYAPRTSMSGRKYTRQERARFGR